jgi:prophage maintenance system killer protein
LLESALARPRTFFGFGEEDSVVLAVVLMAGIARAHAFEKEISREGNKRTAFAAMRLFLLANGYDTAFDDKVSWAEEVIALVEHRSTEEEFARTIRPFVVARQHLGNVRKRRLPRTRLAASVQSWKLLGRCAPPARSRDFGTAGT